MSQNLNDCNFGKRDKKLARQQGRLVMALILVESTNIECVKAGDGGKALGCLQIHQSYWQDAQYQWRKEKGLRPPGSSGPPWFGSYADLTCREGWFHMNACNYSKCIVHLYMRRWAKKRWTTNVKFSPATIAALHHLGRTAVAAGPTNGAWSSDHARYEEKVKREGNYTDEEWGTIDWKEV
mgnify:CR=1 FL=1|tara:strand:+ start:137 stop:679 length:543 start_codon:yes stop_codon:yes gene_type:complete